MMVPFFDSEGRVLWVSQEKLDVWIKEEKVKVTVVKEESQK